MSGALHCIPFVSLCIAHWSTLSLLSLSLSLCVPSNCNTLSIETTHISRCFWLPRSCSSIVLYRKGHVISYENLNAHTHIHSLTEHSFILTNPTVRAWNNNDQIKKNTHTVSQPVLNILPINLQMEWNVANTVYQCSEVIWADIVKRYTKN